MQLFPDEPYIILPRYKKNTYKRHKNIYKRLEEYKVLFIIVHNSPLQISGQTRDPIGLRPIHNSILMFYTYFIIIINLDLLDPRRNTNEHCTYHKNTTKYYAIIPRRTI